MKLKILVEKQDKTAPQQITTKYVKMVWKVIEHCYILALQNNRHNLIKIEQSKLKS